MMTSDPVPWAWTRILFEPTTVIAAEIVIVPLAAPSTIWPAPVAAVLNPEIVDVVEEVVEVVPSGATWLTENPPAVPIVVPATSRRLITPVTVLVVSAAAVNASITIGLFVPNPRVPIPVEAINCSSFANTLVALATRACALVMVPPVAVIETSPQLDWLDGGVTPRSVLISASTIPSTTLVAAVRTMFEPSVCR
jgi:hypothetical protein